MGRKNRVEIGQLDAQRWGFGVMSRILLGCQVGGPGFWWFHKERGGGGRRRRGDSTTCGPALPLPWSSGSQKTMSRSGPLTLDLKKSES